MVISKVEVFPLAYTEPNDDDATRHVVVVRLETQDGTVGWGECVTIFREATFATAALIRYGLGDLVVGKDPYDNETIWESLRNAIWWYGNTGGIAAMAVSALDMALWDVKGKLLKLPLYVMLGGKHSERLPACASSHPKLPTIEGMAAELADHIAQGYQIVKVGFGKRGQANLGVDEARDIAFAREVRAAIGEKAGFVIDIGAKIGAKWDAAKGIRMARAFEPYNLTWYEDPFPPSNIEAYRALRAAVPAMRIATGERWWNLNDYHDLLRQNICDVILIDPGRTEGVTGMHRIGQLAAQYNVAVDPHSWASAINTAASLHLALCAAKPTFFELKPKPSVVQDELVRNPVRQQEGWVYAPEGYGLGADVIEETVHRLALSF